MKDHERTFTNCENHRAQEKCDPWVATLNPPPRSPLNSLQSEHEVKLSDKDENQADEICGKCKWFSYRW